MRVIDFLGNMLQAGRTYILNRGLQDGGAQAGSTDLSLPLHDFAVQMASNIIAGMISKCEFKTFIMHKEVKGDTYYLWNVEPNYNQNSSQFLQKLISKLLQDNKALVISVNDQLLVAESYNVQGYALLPSVFSDVAVQTFGDSFTFDRTFSMSEVMYFQMNDKNVQNALAGVMTGYNALLSMAMGKYRRSGGRKGILKTPRTVAGDKKQQEQDKELIESIFRPYFKAENSVLPIPNTWNYTEESGEAAKKSTSEVTDISTLTKEAISRVAQALRIPPALLVGDVADISSVMDGMLTTCIDPLVDLIQKEINRKSYGKVAYLAGTYLSIDTTHVKHVDIFDSANSADKLLADGIYNADDLRVKLGDEPLNTKASKQYVRTKNYEPVDSPANGGETQ